jgi:methylmalonyl-CoA mutase
MDDLNFAADFPAPTRERWLALVEGVLKGADFTRTLVARTHDGIAIEPLYPKAEDAPRIARAETGRWRVSQRVDHPDPEAASALALADLEGGADARRRPRAGSAWRSGRSRISTARSQA